MATLQDMMDALADAPEEVLPSNYWTYLNDQNLDQLRRFGYANFKRTLALNYFTWLVGPDDPQVRFLKRHLSTLAFLKSTARAKLAPQHAYLSPEQSYHYSLLTYLLWEYIAGRGWLGEAKGLFEPDEGNPPRLWLDGRMISQDLANSFLEYQSIMHSGIDENRVHTVLELGAGYGRTAWAFLKLRPGLRYMIVDIPPALHIAQKYLTTVQPDRRAFRFRRFNDYAAVRDELEASSLIFLQPQQLCLLPRRSVDLFTTISSLHEMTSPQIGYYFEQIARLAPAFVYLKQWKQSHNAFDHVVISERDYPIPSMWQQIFWRDCPVQVEFFEALLLPS